MVPAAAVEAIAATQANGARTVIVPGRGSRWLSMRWRTP